VNEHLRYNPAVTKGLYVILPERRNSTSKKDLAISFCCHFDSFIYVCKDKKTAYAFSVK
jgi:hypothetical protein